MKTAIAILLLSCPLLAQFNPPPTFLEVYGDPTTQYLVDPCNSPEPGPLGDKLSFSPEVTGLYRDCHTGNYADSSPCYLPSSPIPHHLKIFWSVSFDYSCQPDAPIGLIVVGTQPLNLNMDLFFPGMMNSYLLVDFLASALMEYKGNYSSWFGGAGPVHHEWQFHWDNTGMQIPPGLNLRLQCAVIANGTAFTSQALRFQY